MHGRSPTRRRRACVIRLAAEARRSVTVAVRQQSEVPSALDRSCKLPLVMRLGAGDAARDDLARLTDIALQRDEILVIDLLDAFGRESAELASPEKTCHLSCS